MGRFGFVDSHSSTVDIPGGHDAPLSPVPHKTVWYMRCFALAEISEPPMEKCRQERCGLSNKCDEKVIKIQNGSVTSKQIELSAVTRVQNRPK